MDVTLKESRKFAPSDEFVSKASVDRGVYERWAREGGVPTRFIGVGEGILDLRVFDAEEFVDGLLPERAGHA